MSKTFRSLVLLVALSLVLIGCSSEPELSLNDNQTVTTSPVEDTTEDKETPKKKRPDPQEKALLAAIRSTDKLGSYLLDIRMGLPKMPQIGAIEVTGSGSIDARNQAFEMTMDLGPFFAALAKAQPGLPVDEGTMTIVAVGGKMYMNFPLFQQLFPQAKPWIAIDSKSLDEFEGAGFGFTELGSNDPSAALSTLWGVTSADKVGTETVQDVKTTHYRAQVSLRKAAGQAPKKLRKAIRNQALELELAIGRSTMLFDVWVDKSSLIRRIGYTYKFPFALTGASGSKLTFVADLHDFGAAVSVTPPPADQVVKASRLFGGGY